MDKNPTVYTIGESVKPNKKWYQTWRIIYPILGVVVIVELILGLKTLLVPLPKFTSISLQPITGASIFLSADKPNIKLGETVPVKVRIWTGGRVTSGTDLVLRFDPKILEASSTAFVRGKIYTDYPLISVDSKNGVIRVSGIASTAKQTFSGVGEFGMINFKARAAGQTTLAVDFKKGQTDDSNVISIKTNEDVLEKVKDLKLTIE